MRNKVTYRNYIFADPKIAVGTVGLEQSLPITELGIDTFEVEVKCPDKTILDFAQNEPIRYFHRKQQMGIYYVQSIARISPDHYAISAISTLGLLEQMDFYGGIYTGQTVEEVVSAICGNIPVIIKTNLRKIKLYGWLGISSARRALQQVLFAIGANLSTDNTGVLRIENLWSGISAVIPADRIYIDDNNIERQKPVTAVTVLEHQYYPGTERKDLFEGTTLEGQRILFSEPTNQLQADGFTILESGANYAVVSAGTGKLTGCPYVHTTLEVTKPVTTAQVKNEERIEDATLVSLVNSSAVADRMADYYKCREIISADVVMQRERPGQVVSLYHPYDKKMVQGTISKNDINVSAILKGSISALQDFSPSQSGDIAYLDERVILTGKGVWVPPDGVSELIVVAIGKGQPGTDGTDGEKGGSISLWITSAEAASGGTFQRGAQNGGAGGEAGVGGSGGKINRVNVDVSPGIEIAYDATGINAVFGAVSSADGTSSESGYVDPVTGKIFGSKGPDGLPGGAGGNGGSRATSYPDMTKPGIKGYSGGDVEIYAGGNGMDGYYYEGGSASTVRFIIARGGVGGGGAAYGENGGIHPGTGIRPNDDEGGPGGSAKKPDAPTTLGTGGAGGNGGGGGGGAGAVYYQCTASATGYHPGEVFRIVGGAAGTGSKGTEGGPAGIILYFRRPEPSFSGALVTKEKSFAVDKSGRLVIV